MNKQAFQDSTEMPQLFLRLALGIGFLLPVADRLGLLGRPGEANVSWGDWNHFIVYTNSLTPFLNHAMANIMGIIISIAESVFGICLLLGLKTKQVASGAALLTFCFGISMAAFAGLMAPFVYPVFVFTGAAWLLSCNSRYRWSVDDYMNTK